MVKCCIEGCQSENNPGCEMTFHGFPSDEKLKAKWKEITKVTGSVKHKRICPLHFKIEDFVIKGNVISLRQNVLPTVLTPPFKWDSHINTVLLKPSSEELLTDKDDHKKLYENGRSNTDFNVDVDSNVYNNNDNSSLELLLQNERLKEVDGLDRCKCCLESNKLKSMWKEHSHGGRREVYGTMLIECFSLPWTVPEKPMGRAELICKTCVTRLRDAVRFKTEVLASHQLLRAELETVDVDKLKQERDCVDGNIPTEYLQCAASEDNSSVKFDDGDVDGFRDDVMMSDDVSIHEFNDGKEDNNASGKEIEVKLEPNPAAEDKANVLKKGSIHTRRQRLVTLRKKKQSADVVKKSRNQVSREKSRKHNLSRKAVSEALKNEVEYSRIRHTKRDSAKFKNFAENLRNSIEADQRNTMVEVEDAITYNIPHEHIVTDIVKKTKLSQDTLKVSTDANRIKNGVLFVDMPNVTEDEKDFIKELDEVKEEHSISNLGPSRDKDLEVNINNNKSREHRLTEMKKQANNIAIILEFTNATPIRRHGGIGYGCCFCSEEFPITADLKEHTIKGHDVKTKRNYAKGKRPSAYLVKLDITGLKCNLCGNLIDSLEQLFDHLIEVHKKLLCRSAKNYIVPFKFDQEELRCLFCEFICNSFKGLLEHMSVHYRNHVCEVCDAGFLTKNNLFNHAGRHKKGTFKCDYCTKVFDTSSKKAGHQRLVHSKTNGVNRCGYCSEMFGTYRRKEKHLINAHGVVLKKLKCKACDKTFETQTGLRIHTKRDHLIERRFKCSVCDKRCFTNVQLNQHMLKHTGVKTFQCTVCMKAYGRKSTLREHMRIHENDRRFKCEICEVAFVQKSSWRGHMLSKHGQQV